MADGTERARKTTMAPFWSTLTGDFLKIVVPATLTAVGGYLAAMVMTPEELYRRWFGPDVDDYVHRWIGRIGGRYAELHITQQARDTNGRTSNVAGVLFVGSGKARRAIVMEGGADSLLNVTGSWGAGREITISLDRHVSPIHKPGESNVRLFPMTGETGAIICRTSSDPTAESNIDECVALPGMTFFYF